MSQQDSSHRLGGAVQLDDAQEPVGLGERRLRIDRSGPFLTVFLRDLSALLDRAL